MQNQSRIHSGRSGYHACFSIGGDEYAIPAQLVAGVHHTPAIRRVPKAPAFIAGVTNMRGRILPVIDTAGRFGENRPEGSGYPLLVLTRLDGVYYGLLADQLSGILYLHEEMIEKVNPVLVKKEAPFIPAMAVFKKRIIHLLDLEALFFAGLDIGTREKKAYAAHARKTRADRAAGQTGAGSRYLIIQVGVETYGLPIDRLTEVVGMSTIDTMSGGPGYLSGVIRRSAGLIPVIDPRKKYGIPGSPLPGQGRVVIMTSQARSFGLLAGTADEMISIFPDEVQPPPKSVVGDTATHIKQIALTGHDKRLIAILDVDSLFTDAEYQEISAVDGVTWSGDAPETAPAEGDTMTSFLIFQVARHELAFDMACLVAVIPYKTPSPVAKAPPHIQGLIQVKGRLVPVTDLRIHLRMDTADTVKGKYIIVLEHNNDFHGFAVDRMSEILRIPDTDVLKPEAFLKGVDLDAIDGVIRMEDSDRIPMILNVPKAIA